MINGAASIMCGTGTRRRADAWTTLAKPFGRFAHQSHLAGPLGQRSSAGRVNCHKPPKNVPPLPTDEANETLTVRQLVERHSSDQRCSNCHTRIDPFRICSRGLRCDRSRPRKAGSRMSNDRYKGDFARWYQGQRCCRIASLPGRQKKRDVLVKQFCRKLLGYALGRMFCCPTRNYFANE